MLVIETRFTHEIKVFDDILLTIPVMYWEYFTKKRGRERENLCIPACSWNTKIHSPVHRLALSICKRILSSSLAVIFKILFNTITLTTLRFPRGTFHFLFLIKILCPLLIFFVSSMRLPRVIVLHFTARHGKEFLLCNIDTRWNLRTKWEDVWCSHVFRDFDTTVTEQSRIYRFQTAVSLCPSEIGSGTPNISGFSK